MYDRATTETRQCYIYNDMCKSLYTIYSYLFDTLLLTIVGTNTNEVLHLQKLNYLPGPNRTLFLTHIQHRNFRRLGGPIIFEDSIYLSTIPFDMYIFLHTHNGVKQSFRILTRGRSPGPGVNECGRGRWRLGLLVGALLLFALHLLTRAAVTAILWTTVPIAACAG